MIMIEKKRIIVSLLSFCCWPSAAQQTISLYYYDRPPFIIEQADGTVAGILGTRASEVFKTAGIPFIWQKIPAKRQLSEIKANDQPACALGWYNLGDRPSYATFTHPIYLDHGIVAIVRFDFPTIDGAPLQQYLADGALRVLVKQGLSYGPIVASQIASARASIIFVTAEQPQLSRMIALGRADMMFATVEEAEMLLTGNESGPDALKILRFSNIPASSGTDSERYIMCDKSVPSEVVEKLNAAIDKLKK